MRAWKLAIALTLCLFFACLSWRDVRKFLAMQGLSLAVQAVVFFPLAWCGVETLLATVASKLCGWALYAVPSR